MPEADWSQRRLGESSRLGRVEIALTLWVAITGLAVARAYPLWRGAVRVGCPLWQVFGIPCPTCGGTRALAALAAGDWQQAVAWNPLVSLAGMAMIAFVPYAALTVGGLTAPPVVPIRFPGPTKWIAGLLLVANWMYLCWTFSG